MNSRHLAVALQTHLEIIIPWLLITMHYKNIGTEYYIFLKNYFLPLISAYLLSLQITSQQKAQIINFLLLVSSFFYEFIDLQWPTL